MKLVYKTFASTLVLGVLLAGCGGGSDAPLPTPQNASLAVSGATDVNLNGIYSTTAVALSVVEKNNPIGGEPEVCAFRFSGLQQGGSGARTMDGDVRYIPGTNSLRVIFVSISGVEFNSRDTTNAAVDKPNHEVDLTAKTLTASSGNGATITLTGSIPMRESRPEGC